MPLGRSVGIFLFRPGVAEIFCAIGFGGGVVVDVVVCADAVDVWGLPCVVVFGDFGVFGPPLVFGPLVVFGPPCVACGLPCVVGAGLVWTVGPWLFADCGGGAAITVAALNDATAAAREILESRMACPPVQLRGKPDATGADGPARRTFRESRASRGSARDRIGSARTISLVRTGGASPGRRKRS